MYSKVTPHEWRKGQTGLEQEYVNEQQVIKVQAE